MYIYFNFGIYLIWYKWLIDNSSYMTLFHTNETHFLYVRLLVYLICIILKTHRFSERAIQHPKQHSARTHSTSCSENKTLNPNDCKLMCWWKSAYVLHIEPLHNKRPIICSHTTSLDYLSLYLSNRNCFLILNIQY